MTATLAPTERWFLGRYDTELDQMAVFGELSSTSPSTSRSRPADAGSTTTASSHSIQEQPEGFRATRLDGNQERARTATSQAEPDLQVRPRSPRVRDVFGGFPRRRQQPAEAASLLPRDYAPTSSRTTRSALKSEWLDNRLRFNIAAYYMEWEDFAVQIEDPQTAVFQLGFVNLPSAEIPGVEADFAFS